MNPIEQLKAVLCGPDGQCCISGSGEDRAIVDRALHSLSQKLNVTPYITQEHFYPAFPEKPDAQKPVASIYIGMNGEREFDDWRHDLPAGRNELYTAPPTLTPPDGWAEAVGLAKIMAQLSKPLSERRAEILAQAILDMDTKIKEQK